MIDEKIFQHVLEIRRDLHQHPETGFDVERTAALAAHEMRQLGIEVRTQVGRTGVIGDLNVPGSPERIALRADMDALPMQEASDTPYKSTVDGKAHMCGHDAHTAMLIGAAHILSKCKGSLKKSVRFIFQPSEEQTPGGALGMIQDGCLEGVTAIYGLHVWPWLDVGTIGICPGPMMAQSDVFDIQIRGQGGHAAAPHHTINPIYVGSQLVTLIQSLTSRRVDPQHSAVVSVTRFQGGSAYNVIPEEATLSGTVRTYSPEVHQAIKSELLRVVEQGASCLGAEAALTYHEGYPPLINTPSGKRLCQKDCSHVFKERPDPLPRRAGHVRRRFCLLPASCSWVFHSAWVPRFREGFPLCAPPPPVQP